MKVSIAARIFSNTMAAAMESMVSSNLVNKLPPQAMHTAEFIHDMDRLFDSFNGRSPKLNQTKPYRRCMSEKSPHRTLWLSLLPKIRSWKFLLQNGTICKEQIPFKTGWITTIEATMGLFNECRKLGFRFLRTRSLNQDCLENYFSTIRSYNASNTNPNPYQFINTFKTTVLNNFVDVHTHGRNCERDDNSLLENLQSFLQDSDNNNNNIVPISEIYESEFENILIPTEFNKEKDDTYDDQVMSYVCGFLVKKLRALGCERCKENLTTDILAPFHTYTMFRENDEKNRLIYVTHIVSQILKKIYDTVMFLMPSYGHVLNISKKLFVFLNRLINFEWFTCKEHVETIKKDFIQHSVTLIIKKYCDDLYRTKQHSLNRIKYVKKKVNTFQHK